MRHPIRDRTAFPLGVRALSALIGAALLVGMSLVSLTARAAESIVTIADPALATCIASEVPREGGQNFSASMLASIEVLRCGGKEPADRISNLAGINNLTGLTELSVSGSSVSDLRPLSGLTKLGSLVLTTSGLSDLGPLASLSGLRSLSIGSPKLGSLSSLAGLSSLTELKVTGPVGSLAGLSGLSRLVSLSVVSDSLVDLGPVAQLTGLRQLTLSTPRAGSLTPVSGLRQLTELRVESGALSSVAPISGLTGLTTLQLSVPGVQDLSPLGGLANLTFLSVTDSQASDVAPVGRLKKLTELYLERGQISDVSPFRSLTSLNVLSLDGNLITDPGPLASLRQLSSLSLADNQIGSVSSLRPLVDYYWLDLSGNQITDLSPLKVAAGKEADRRLSAQDQVIQLPVEVGVPAALSLKSLDGSQPKLTTVAGVSVSSGQVTVSSAGSYVVTFAAGNFDSDRYRFSGTVMVGTNTLLSSVPTIRGDAAVGSVLIASAGRWAPAPVTLAYQWLRGGVAIPGATGSTYTVGSADLGKKLSVRVTGSKTGFDDVSVTSAATAAATDAIVSPSPTPTISGNVLVGSVLKAVTGTWDPNASLTYRWLRSGTPIPGATGATYLVSVNDVGSALQVSVTGSRSGYASVSRSSAKTKNVPALTAFAKSPTPTLSGTAKVGKTLSARVGTWSPAPTGFAYQWLRSGVAISGAKAASYTLTAADRGKTVAVKVTASKPGLRSLARTSKASAKVASGSLVTSTPKTSTTKPVVGRTITAKAVWGPGTVKLTYQWYRVSSSGKSKAISGAKSATYRVSGSLAGYRLKVKVTGTRSGYSTVYRYSAKTSRVAKASFVVGASPSVAVAGGAPPTVGKVLTATPGVLTPTPKFTYQWYRGGKAIRKATARTYRLTKSDLGKQIKVRVKATRTGYVSRTRYGYLSGLVKR